MKKPGISVLFAIAFALAACGKKAPDTAAPASNEQPAAAAPAAASPPATPQKLTEEQRELAKKQALLDYATTEDQYINDPKAQWAATARASSTFGEGEGRTPADSNLAKNAAGPVNEKIWRNNNLNIGFDWLELGYDKPVSASEVRVVFGYGKGVEAINKLELQDTDGGWHTVWSGLSDMKADQRGARTWFVRKFEPTPYQVKAVKITIANNVESSYKEVDAVQLVSP